MTRRMGTAIAVACLLTWLGIGTAAHASEHITFSASLDPRADSTVPTPMVFLAEPDGTQPQQIGYGVDPQLTAGGDVVVYTETGGGNKGSDDHWDDAIATYSIPDGKHHTAWAPNQIFVNSHWWDIDHPSPSPDGTQIAFACGEYYWVYAPLSHSRARAAWQGVQRKVGTRRRWHWRHVPKRLLRSGRQVDNRRHSRAHAAMQWGDCAPSKLALVRWDQGSGDPRLLIGGPATEPTFFPDGKRIAFTEHPPGTPPGPGQISVVDVASGDVTALTSVSEFDEARSPSVSPDGQTVVFAGRHAGAHDFDLYTVDVSSGEVTRLTTTGGDQPTWGGDDMIMYRDPVTPREIDPESGCGPTPGDRLMSLDPVSGDPQLVMTAPLQATDPRYPDCPISFFHNVSLRPGRSTDAAAIYFRPRLLFDTSERFRPLDIAAFLSESASDNIPLHRVCDPGLPIAADGSHCAPVTSSADLALASASTSWLETPSADSASTARSSDPACWADDLNDCDNGPSSRGYYHIEADQQGYDYIDYWFFYRYNDFFESLPDPAVGNHPGDWEGVTLAPSLTNPATFDFASFSQHGTYYNYTRDALQCDAGGQESCGVGGAETGRRVVSFVANGSHANYPVACSARIGGTGCWQSGGLPEKGHDGARPWGNNDATAVSRLPADGGWFGSGPDATFTDWPGSWGGEDHRIRSPGCQDPHFHSPWLASTSDDSCASGAAPSAAASRHSVQRLDSLFADRRTADACRPWFGVGVVTVACQGERVTRAVARGRFGTSGALQMSIQRRGGARPRRDGSGAGLAQIVGDPLRAGDRLTVRVPAGQPADLLVRVRMGTRLVLQRYRATPGRHRWYIVRSQNHPKAVRLRGHGEELAPAGETVVIDRRH